MQAVYYPMAVIPIINVPATEYCAWWTDFAISQRKRAPAGMPPP